MHTIALVLTFIFSLFSTSVMSYIALATPIGPWIAPTLVLLGILILRLLPISSHRYTTILALSTAGGSLGGILATACAFSFPTLFYLDPSFFAQWLAKPWYFVGFMSWLSLSAGGLGYIIAGLMEEKCIVRDQLPFPIGQLMYKMISSYNQVRKSVELLIGIISASLFALVQMPSRFFPALIPHSVTLLNPISWRYWSMPALTLRLDVLPMLIAIGFISGSLIAIPLIAGTITRFGIIDPLNAYFFPHLGNLDFVLAFGSGMVVFGALQSFLDVPKLIRSFKSALKEQKKFSSTFWYHVYQSVRIFEILLIVLIMVGFLIFTRFSFAQQLYLVLGTCICTYQIVIIAGEIGLAQLGRFATFVMVPAMFLFNLDFVQLTVIATFVEISGGVATDLLFGRKMGHLAHINSRMLKRYQIIGLVLSSLAVGCIFWLLITRFGIGPEGLAASRAAGRALLIKSHSFNFSVLGLGCIFGFLLKYVKLNPMLVLGGMLMPLPYSLGLIIGGLLALLSPARAEWEAFWSGVFAANSITELIKTLL